jgi:predicted ATP-binding protein involved in virulence
MPTETNAPDAMHFRSIRLENVRAFGSSQTLELFDDDGAVSRWNLILGENGVGKTTLMQALAVMRPVPALKPNPGIDKSEDAGPPTLSTAKLSEYENDEFMRFIRRDGSGVTTMEAVLDAGNGITLDVCVEISGSTRELDNVKFREAAYELRASGPLVIGYGAARHVGHNNHADVEKRDATKSLFADAIDLYDAELLMEQFDHAAKSDPEGENGADGRRFNRLKAVVASLLEGLTAEDIEVRGPSGVGGDPDRRGVHVRTPSGFVPLKDLSLGYQGMFAWIVDLAWRLFSAFPDSADPLSESAIVLIDEVDLHLHPRWQRDLAKRLLTHFPSVQFIATTHSPITAQEALAEGCNVAVVRWQDHEARILNRPIPSQKWRFDQLLVSELFGFFSDRSKEAEEKLVERIKLIRNPNRSAEQDARLRELDQWVESLPTARSPTAQSFEDLMMDFARDFEKGVRR